jgi:hypothetical protein
MTSFEFLISLAAVLIALTAVVASMFYVMQKRRESYYNEQKQKIELDLLRHNVESQIYGLNERLSKTAPRFKDSFHLQIDGNNQKVIKESGSLKLNDFLKSAGLKESDLHEEDYVFVLTPFHTEFDVVYETVRNVCDKADIRCIRGDEQNFKGDIFSHVLKSIVQAKVVIVNLGGRNPNVLYELGIAHALDKTTILISHMLDKLPVDIKSKRIVLYKNLEELEETLPLELLKVMK